MAKSQSVALEAEAEKVWGAVVRLISSAGYAVSETNAAAIISSTIKRIYHKHPAAGGLGLKS